MILSYLIGRVWFGFVQTDIEVVKRHECKRIDLVLGPLGLFVV